MRSDARFRAHVSRFVDFGKVSETCTPALGKAKRPSQSANDRWVYMDLMRRKVKESIEDVFACASSDGRINHAWLAVRACSFPKADVHPRQVRGCLVSLCGLKSAIVRRAMGASTPVSACI
jgi:hypothetical protein